MRLPLAASIILLAGSTAFAQDGVVALSLKDAIRQAVEKNLDVRAELYNPALAEADLRKNKAIFETHLTLDARYQDSTTLATNNDGNSTVKTLTMIPGAYRLLPIGGTVSVAYDSTRTDSNRPTSLSSGSTVTVTNRPWQTELSLTLSQPLLKNFGRDATELNIRVAEFGKDESLQRFRAKLLATVAAVESAYYTLSSLRDDLASRKVSLDLAKRILSETEARVKAGVLPAMEILNAQFGVAQREKELIDAEKSVRDQVDALRVLLHMDDVRDILTSDAPKRDEFAMAETEAVRRALAQSPALSELQSQLASNELQARVARGKTQPDLNLSSKVALTGQAASYGRTVDQTAVADYPVWSIGLKLDYPLGNQAAENEYVRNRLKTEQTRMQIAALQESVSSEARAAVRTVQTSFKQLEVADRGRVYAEERLKAYLKKSEVGLATTKDVLDVENDLATARTTQIKAQVAYAVAISQLLKTTGDLLEREGITVSSSVADELFRSR